jgi:hypothetical protein
MQEIMTPMELHEIRRHTKYDGYSAFQPTQISSFLKRPLLTMRTMLEVLQGKGIDYFGKIRIAVIMRNANQKVLFYREHMTFYDDYEVRFCKHGILFIPVFDINTEDLALTDKIIERIMLQVRKGFSLPF